MLQSVRPRHSYATALRAGGRDLPHDQQLLGHCRPRQSNDMLRSHRTSSAQASEFLSKSGARGKDAWQAARDKEDKAS